MTPDDFEERYRVTRDEAMKSKPPSMTPAEFEDAIRKAGDSAMMKLVEEMKSGDSASAGNACPYCEQNLDEGVCQHWVATLCDDSECCARDAVTPLYFVWVEHWTAGQEEMIGCFDTYFETLCSLCNEVNKQGREKRESILNRAKSLPSTEQAIVRDAVKLLDGASDREDDDTMPELLSGLDSQLKDIFTDFFLRFDGKRSKADQTIYNMAGSWSSTHYCAEDAGECVASIIRECRSATDRLRKLIQES